MNYTLKFLEGKPTISEGHTDDLKIDTGSVRVWLSRMTVEDGMPYDNAVTIEVLNYETYQWEVVLQFEAK